MYEFDTTSTQFVDLQKVQSQIFLSLQDTYIAFISSYVAEIPALRQ